MAETPLKAASMKGDRHFLGLPMAGFVVVTAGKSGEVVGRIPALWIKNKKLMGFFYS